jgi:hypothetical protein
MFGIVPHSMVFDNWDGVMKYLKHVNIDKDANSHNKWRFFDFDKVYGEA